MGDYSKINGVFIREGTKPFDYSDGDSVEENLRALISGASDRSLYSEELSSRISDWPTLYHLSPHRSNLLVPFVRFIKGRKVLEIGCGLGAITRCLAEFGADVTAIDGSFRRVSIAAERCRDCPDVKFYCDNFEDFELDEKFDLVTIIGVLEYAPVFFKGDHPCESMLKKAKTFLKPDGRLFLAVENRLGIKYFNNVPEDHVPVPFYGIQDLYDDKEAHTYGKEELSGILKSAGFDKFSFHYPFPDYKLPTLYLHPAAFSAPDLNVPDLLRQNINRPYCGGNLFYEDAAAVSLFRNGLLEDFANSFVVLSGDGFDETLCSTRVQPTRKKTMTSVIQIANENSGLAVYRTSLTEFLSGENTRDPRAASPYIKGELLFDQVQKRLARKICDLKDIAAAFSPWVDFLKENLIPGTADLPSCYWDCTPFNIIVRGSEFIFFDQEDWEGKPSVSIGLVIFRGLANSLGHLSFLNLSPEVTRNILSLTKMVVNEFGYQFDPADFLAYEHRLQAHFFQYYPHDFEQFKASLLSLEFRRQQNDELKAAATENESLTNRNRVLEVNLEAERREHKTFETALRKTEDTLRQKYRDCESLEKQNCELRRDRESLETERDSLKNQHREVAVALDKLQKDYRSLEAEYYRVTQLCDEITHSKSWRIFAPARLVMKGLRFWRRNGTGDFLRKASRKIESKSPFFARQMERQRKFRDIRKEQGIRKAFAYFYDKIYAKLLPKRYRRKIYRKYCDRFSHATLIIDHNLGGGANVYRNNFIKERLKQGEKCVLLHNNMYFLKHRDYSLKFYEESVEKFEDVHLNDLSDVLSILDRIAPQLIVYNSLVFYPDIAPILRWMKRCKGDLLLLMHDFFPICQMYNMVDDRNQFCRMERDCDKCLAGQVELSHLYGKPFSKNEWKKLWTPVFAKSGEIRFFSESTQEIIKAWGMGNEEKYTLVPHSMAHYIPPKVQIVPGCKPKIGVIGAIYNIPKGILIVEELARKIAPEPLTVIGTYGGRPVDNIVETGAFTRDTLPGLIREHTVNMLLIPSVWPETFSYLTSEIIMMKLPLLVFDLGAQKEKTAKYPFGAIIPEMTADSVLETADELYRRLKKDPGSGGDIL